MLSTSFHRATAVMEASTAIQPNKGGLNAKKKCQS
jgi:hypothetical protein